MLRQIGDILFGLLTYSETGNEEFNSFMWESCSILRDIALVGLLLLILIIIFNPNLRKRKRTEDRLMFWECVIVLSQLIIERIYSYCGYCEGWWVDYVYFIAPSLIEYLYMLAILQWLVFVDYSLYRSEDHLKRRYKNAALPIFILVVADIAQSLILFRFDSDDTTKFAIANVLQLCKLIVNMMYVLNAVHLVTTHAKESREPRFIRLGAFIIPFIFGALFRIYSSAFLAFGIILTYGAVRRRDKYLDHDTGFFNRAFLEYRGKYRDIKDYTGGNGILVCAVGHGQDMAKILSESIPADINIFAMGEDRFLLLTEALRGSAVKMVVMTITEAAEASDDPYTPEIITAAREKDESAGDFASRLLGSC